MIRIGISELHGIAQESIRFPPTSVSYCEAHSSHSFISNLIKSPAKGVLAYYDKQGFDYIEAPIFPIRTNCNWVYTPADAATALAFNFSHLPTPRLVRELYLKHLFEKPNFKALLFKSQAGLKTLDEYPVLSSQKIKMKSGVLYPAVRKHEEVNRSGRKDIQIIFVGEFFRKGGIHVVNAFERLQKEFSNLKLVICADIEKHFEHDKKDQYLKRIFDNKSISLDFVKRDRLFSEFLPASDIFVSPTYNESFGYALLEAMSLGLPVIATNFFAIPEIVEHNKSGLLIDTVQHDFIANQKGYSISGIPEDFIDYMDNEVYMALRELVISPEKRLGMGDAGRNIAGSKFSFETRNEQLSKIYSNSSG